MPDDETILFAATSPYNDVFVTETEDGVRVLRLGELDAEAQSYDDLEADPTEPPILDYIAHLCAAFAFLDRPPKRALLLGFGAGITSQHWHRLYPDLIIDAVDIDPVVASVAFTHFDVDPHPNVRLHLMDARTFVEEAPHNYDVIAVDCFDGPDIPHHLATLEFYHTLARRLSGAGVVISNQSDIGEHGDSNLRTFFEAWPSTVNLLVGNVEGGTNHLVVGFERSLSEVEIEERLREYSLKTAVPDLLKGWDEYSCHPPQRWWDHEILLDGKPPPEEDEEDE